MKFSLVRKKKRHQTKFLSDMSTSLAKGVSGSLLQAKTQTSLARLTAGIDACPFPFVLQHQILKGLKTHTTGSKAVSWFLHTSVLMQINLFILCNKMHTVFWSVWMTSLQRILIYHFQLQESHCSSQASQMHPLSMIGSQLR